MKLTHNQKTVITSVLVKTSLGDVVKGWELKHDRNLVVDELLELCSKLKITVSKEIKRQLREIADKGR